MPAKRALSANCCSSADNPAKKVSMPLTALAVLGLCVLWAAAPSCAQSQAITLSETSLDVDEGSRATYRVTLGTLPTADVTVTIGGTSGTDLSVNNTSLTFTTTDWNTAQTVTVSASTDTDATDDSATLTHTASGGDYGTVTQDLPVTVNENTSVTLYISGFLSSISEADEISLSVRLNTPMSEAVTVTFSAAPGDANTTADDFTLTPDPPEITISAGDSLTDATVTLTPVDDHKTGHKNVLLTLMLDNTRVTVSGGTTRDVLIVNDDLAQITLELAPEPIFEDGRAARVRARLVVSRPQTEQVTLRVAAMAVSPTVAGDFTLSGETLTFAPGSFMSLGTVEITANDDTDMVNETVTVTAEVLEGQGVIEPDPLTLDIVDDDETGRVTMSLRLTPDRITEAGGFTVSTVTAEVSRPLAQAATVTIDASPNQDNATTTVDDFTLSTNKELLIGVGETARQGQGDHYGGGQRPLGG